jgi:hypothetical protein
MTSQATTQSDSDRILQVFDYLENGPPSEIQSIQCTVNKFKDIHGPEKRIELLEALVDDTPIHILALALACKSKPNCCCNTHLIIDSR